LLLHAEGEEDVARHFHHLRINTRKHITTSISDNISSSNELIAQVITQWQEAATPLLSCSIDHCLRLSKPSLDLLPLLPMKTGLVGVDIGIDYHSTSENLKTILKSLCTDGPLQLQYLTYSGHIAWPHLFTQSNPAHAWQARFIASNPEKRIQQTDITTLIQALDTHNIPFTHLHMLQVHHHTLGFSLMNE
jgi:hypothetical protein